MALTAVAWAKAPQPKQAGPLPPAAHAAKQFQHDAGHTRLLIFASPTCPACRRGVEKVIGEVMGNVGDKSLRAYVVWVPMLDGDNAEAARLEASLYPDKRIAHYWDDGAHAAAELGPKLGLAAGKKAWDVYLVYDKHAKWGAAPAFWMHQLDGVTLAPWLDAVKLRAKVEDLIR
jgi:hypothetical protein